MDLERDIGLEEVKNSWIEPDIGDERGKCGRHWSLFLKSSSKQENKTKRALAKCRKCSKSLDSKKGSMMSHVASCKSISVENRKAYFIELNKPSTQSSSKESTSSVFFTKPTEDFVNKIELTLFKAFLTGNIPFRFADNYYFRQALKELARCEYTPPNSQDLHTIVPVQAALVETHNLNVLKSREIPMTLSLDGWADTSGKSIYAVQLAHRNFENIYIGNLELIKKKHTAINIVKALEDLLIEKEIDLNLIFGITTDSSRTMVKVRRDWVEKNPHMLQLGCCLHAINLIVKDIMSKQPALDIFKKNLALVNYFTKDGYWSETLDSWRKSTQAKHGLSTFCETRWHSACHMSSSVKDHELGFAYCLQLCRDNNTDTPDIPSDKKDIISDKNHFLKNSDMMKVLRPITDAIGRLEKKETSICDIWKEIILMYKTVRNVNFLGYQDVGITIKRKALEVINERAIAFNVPVYILGFFFHPFYRNAAISKYYTIKKVAIMVLSIAKRTPRFNDRKLATELVEQIERYAGNKHPFSCTEANEKINPQVYWENVVDCSLRQFVLYLLNTVTQAAGIEQLFSGMSFIKTKAGNKMEVPNLCMITQLKSNYLSEIPAQERKRKRNVSEEEASAFDIESVDDNLGTDTFRDFLITQLETEEDFARITSDNPEDKVVDEEEAEDPVIRDNSFISRLFDIDTMVINPPNTTRIKQVNQDSNWSIAEFTRLL